MSKGISPWIGWGVSTLLLLFMNRNKNEETESSTVNQQPSKFTEDTGNQIGNCIPVVLGRTIIKNPLISFYGDFDYKPYTEEYGNHSGIDAEANWWPIILGVGIAAITGGTAAAGIAALGYAVVALLTKIMQDHYNDHESRTTIQKGFFYYLGWQHILCWSGYNFGLRRIWMNVYDSDIEQSTEQGVWGSNSVIWRNQNATGIKIVIDNEEMFGGPDESGGFKGYIWFYFGTYDQAVNGWMKKKMSESENIPEELKGLSPKYPLFATCVINGEGSDKDGNGNHNGEFNTTLVVIGADYSDPDYSSNWVNQWEKVSLWCNKGLGVRLGANLRLPGYSQNEKYVTYWNTPTNSDNRYYVYDINLSVTGQNSSIILSRIDSEVLPLHPAYCIVEINCFNDYMAFNDINITKSNIDAIMQKCLDSNILPLFVVDAFSRPYNYWGAAAWDKGQNYPSGAIVRYGENIYQLVKSLEPITLAYVPPPDIPNWWNYLYTFPKADADNIYSYYTQIEDYVNTIFYGDLIPEESTKNWFNGYDGWKDKWTWKKSANFKQIPTIPDKGSQTFAGSGALLKGYYDTILPDFEPEALAGWLPLRPPEAGYPIGHKNLSWGDAPGGAYIGKQATVPEMWFEVVNYPTNLKDNNVADLKRLFNEKAVYLYDTCKQLAEIEGIPDDAEDEYESFLNAGSAYNIDNLQPVIDIVSALQSAISPDTMLYIFLSRLSSLLSHGVWTLGTIGEDCNPAEVIWEILGNPYWGCNYRIPLDTVDIDSVLMLGATCEEEGLGISCFITNTAQAYEYIDKILTHINGVKYDDPKTGKLTFKLIRSDYYINDLKVFNPSNCENLEFTRLDWSETTSTISVNFVLADNKYVDAQLQVSDYADVIITGVQTESSIDGTYFTEPKNAKILAQTQLQSAAYPLALVNFVCNRYGYDVNIGEPIVINWEPYGIDRQIYRVTDIDYGTLTNGKIIVTALEDVFGFEQTNFEFSTPAMWEEPEEEPEDIVDYLLFEAPYEMTYSLDTYIFAQASRPSEDTIKWHVWRKLDEDIYENTVSSMKWSMMGKLVYGYLESYDVNDEVGFEIIATSDDSNKQIYEKMVQVNSNFPFNNKNTLNLLECDGEIMSYAGINYLPNGNYNVFGIVRGIYDTLPKNHNSYATVHFLDYKLNVNLDSPVCISGITSQESFVLTTSSSTDSQNIDDVDKIVYETVRRAEAPSVMGNLKFSADRGIYTEYNYNYPDNTVFSGNIIFTFKARNKFVDSSIKGQSEDSVAVTIKIKNTIKLYCDSDEYVIRLNAYDENENPSTLESMTLKWSDFCKKLGFKVKDSNDVHLEIMTYDSVRNLYSYDHYDKQVIINTPTLVGIVGNEQEAQAFANSIVVDDKMIEIPATSMTNGFTLGYEYAPLIFIGIMQANGEFYNLNGAKYDLAYTAYRIDGAIEDTNNPGTYIASIHEVNIEDYYVFGTNYTGIVGDKKYYWRVSGNYEKYNIYTTPSN